ncbi:hypothetical protein [Streptomyces sp. uw30]|uniref:hypothetical protein n=1 Tax=Streptomyces sp. uw30 TaxID=1828179 RepID=UPI0029058992|nr:hypothetical protein [Streptomyces sp. uw30]
MAASTPEHAALVGEALDLIEAEDAERLVPELLGLFEMTHGRWRRDGHSVAEAVYAADTAFQARLLHGLAARYHELEPGAVGRRHIVDLLNSFRMLRAAAEGQPPATRAALIGLIADQDVHHDPSGLVRLADQEFADGRELSDEFVAVIRRSYLTVWNGKKRLGDLVARLDGPPVNPGETWSDRALAEVAGLGGDCSPTRPRRPAPARPRSGTGPAGP